MKKIIIVLLISSLLFTACSEPTISTEEIKQESKQEVKEEVKEEKEEPKPEPTLETEPAPLPIKVAVVVARDSYAADELNPVVNALKAAGYEPVITSDALGQANGHSEKTDVEITFNDLTADNLRGIVLIGGSDALWGNSDLHRLLNEVNDLNRVVSAICLASVTLAKAGIIAEGDEACWFNCDIADSAMAEAGVIDSGQPVFVDGTIITGNGPLAAPAFADEIVKALDLL